MSRELCPVCRSPMRSGLQPWHRECACCAYEQADLAPAINEMQAHGQIDEQFREKGLRALRVDNFRALLKVIEESGLKSGRLLDVGCAHGWFLEAASGKFEVLGIEPDQQVCEATRRRGLLVRQGFFPSCLAKEEQFDGIVFNDVLEHIPDIHAVLADCREHLRPGGALILNLPNSSGFFYRAARWLCRLGMSSFFDRLWQKGLPSPHLHYFNSDNLTKLLQANGFEVRATGRLPAIRLQGLYTRVSYTGRYVLPMRLLICLLVVAAFPILRLMPCDIMYLVSVRK